jgi:hypothetical protein
MEELREREKSHAIEDIMYVSILERFLSLSVDMLPHMDGEPRAPLPFLSCPT